MRKRLHALGIAAILVVATADVAAQISSASGPGRPQGPPAPALVPIPADVAKMPFMNPALPTDQRVEDLLHRMTLEEKASQLVNQARAIPRLGIGGGQPNTGASIAEGAFTIEGSQKLPE